MTDVTDLDTRRGQGTPRRRKPSRNPGRIRPTIPAEDKTTTPSPAGFCPACSDGLHLKCLDALDVVLENGCACRCWDTRELHTTFRAVLDMIARHPERAAFWLFIKSRTAGGVHVCERIRE